MAADLPSRGPAAITGLGVITAAGTDLDGFWERALRPPEVGPPTGPVDFDPSPWIGERTRWKTEPETWYAVAAAALALEDAGLAPDPWRTAVCLSTVYAATDLIERGLRAVDEGAPPPMHLGAEACGNAAAAHVAMAHGLHGPNRSVVNACAGGSQAIGDAVDLLALGRCDSALAGAAQGPLPAVFLANYRAMRVATASGEVRPFDLRRDGTHFTDGAVVAVLEPAALAAARGATVLAEVSGQATVADATSMVASSQDTIRSCMALALDDAGIDPASVAAVIAHGTATRMNDAVEAAAIAELFPHRPPVTSVKRAFGHTMAGAGPVNVAVATLAFRHGVLPPVSTDLTPDPSIAELVDVVGGEPRPLAPGPIVVNAFGLGGTNTTLVLSPPA